VDEDVQAVGPVLEDEIRAAADDHARPLVREIADHVRLADVELVRDGHAVHDAHGPGRDGDVEQKAAGHGGVFPDLLDELVGEAALLGHAVDKLLVVIGDAEALGDFLADGSAAAAKLTADGDYLAGHGECPLSIFLLYRARA